MGGNSMEKINEQNNLYEQFLKYSYWDLKELFKKAKTKEEQDFYITLSNIVLQKEQKKVIGKE
jgi:6-phosphogluconate dehydrogenase